MAEASVVLSQDAFSCPICLDLLKDPVAIPCGHSFCMDCITGCWDQEELKGVYSCPQCRQTFTPRPVLARNTMLAEVVDKLKIMGFQAAHSAHSYAEPGDVECDVCVGRKRKAVKSCLVCLSSYCETHLRVHSDLNPGKKHKVIDAAGKLEGLICSRHDKLLEVFCRTDQTCICLLCVMDEHRGHETVSAAAERIEKQKQLEESCRKTQRTIQERYKHLQQMKEAIKSFKHSAQVTVEDSDRIFTEIIRSIERRRSEVTQLIRDQEKAEVSQAEELMEKMEWEIAELKKRDAELEQLSQTEDHTSFLQSFSSLTDPEDSSSNISFSSDVSFEEVKDNVSQLKDQVEDLLKYGIDQISMRAKTIRISSPHELLTRRDFLTCLCQLNLDPNTAEPRLHLSESNNEVTCKRKKQSYPDNPERFDIRVQVLCKEALTGRCYWEVEWSTDRDNWGGSVAVSYKEICRKGGDQQVRFGYNKHSWSLRCSSTACSFVHNGEVTELNVIPNRRIGVYVDHKAGILSFYSISGDKMTLLHKVQTTFTQPLCPGFWVQYYGSILKLCL
ncbi:tripartite motif-containing protein 16-like [Sardina pilchardus]|uniref:tripartite motif-containing protein 16-like n=1 Tax=Sardina pilchardus TaxID=27697 RepID=UPI002E145A1F